MEGLLSVGAITQILENSKPANPVLQIIGYKPMTPDQMAFGQQTDELRYRLMIGDGLKAHQYCVITNQDLVDDIKNGRLEKWSIIRVTSYQTVDYGDGPPENRRRLIYILNLEVVRKGSDVNRKLSCQDPNQQSDFSSRNDNSNNYTPPQRENPPPPPMQQQQVNRQPMNNFNSNNYNSNNFNSPGRVIADSTTQPQPYPMGGGMSDMIRSPRSMRNSHEHQTIGINELTPYIGRWIVKGRVTSKSGIREYNNAKGGGKLFNFTLADKTGEIKVTAFNADCERVFPFVEQGKVYVLGRAQVKNADKRYTTAEHEITLNNDSLLEEVVDDKSAQDVPLAKFNFVSIGSLATVPPNQPVDLIGAIERIGDAETIVSRTKNKELRKRTITIVDMSRHSIAVTLWGEQADTFAGAEEDIFITKAARIGTYGGVSASAGDCVFINPDIPEDYRSGADQWKTLSDMTNLEQAKVIASSGQQSGSYAKCKAILMSVGKNPVYKCCPTDKCGKKLVDTQSGELKCEKCQQTFSTYKYRYKTDVEICDMTSSSWVTLWDEKAEIILGKKPEELEKYMRMESKEMYEKIITQPNFLPFIFTLRQRIDTYNQEERVKLTVVNLTPCDTQAYGRKLMDDIKKMSAM